MGDCQRAANSPDRLPRLHLGCGNRYLQGYVNIDLPPAAHSIHTDSVADLHSDILTLRYPTESVDEVRLHHVFEHFPRPIACALLASWFSWLRRGGTIRIEVPDFERSSREVLKTLSPFNRKCVAERHIFGSHEAGWAAHCEGYTPRSLKSFIERYGFKVIKTKKNKWKGTYNVELIANRSICEFPKKDFELVTEDYLRNFLVDDSQSELRLLSIWMGIFNQQMDKSWATEAQSVN